MQNYLFVELLLLGFLLLNSLLAILIELKIIQYALFTCVLLEYFKHLETLLQFNL